MKEAMGELNMTVVTIVAIAAIAALFALVWPSISSNISSSWGGICAEYDTNGNCIRCNDPAKQPPGC